MWQESLLSVLLHVQVVQVIPLLAALFEFLAKHLDRLLVLNLTVLEGRGELLCKAFRYLMQSSYRSVYFLRDRIHVQPNLLDLGLLPLALRFNLI